MKQSKIKFHIEWQDSPGVKDLVLARTWSRLVIEVDGHCVTEIDDRNSGSSRSGVYGSVFPLCQWIVENWWFLLNEVYRFPKVSGSFDILQRSDGQPWVQRHSLLAAREGGALPDLMIFRDSESIVARWVRGEEDTLNPSIRFTGSGEARLDPDDVEQEFRRVVNQIIDRLENVDEPAVRMLQKEWESLLVTLQNGEKKLCEWSARLGIDPHDPDELTDTAAEELASLVTPLEDSVRNDLLDAGEFLKLQNDIKWLTDARNLAKDAGKSDSDPWKSDIPKTQSAHSLGYDYAVELRRHLRVEDAVGNMEDILRRIGWANSPIHSLHTTGNALEGVVERSNEDALVAVVSASNESSKRFKSARAVFLSYFGHQRNGPRLVTTAHTWDQKASRSFAAEFLAPAQGIRRRIETRVSDEEIEELAQFYKVSPLVIFHQIDNHNLASIG